MSVILGQTAEGRTRFVLVDADGRLLINANIEASATDNVTMTTSTVNATTASTIISAANADRKLLLLVNLSDTDIWISIGSAAVVGACLELLANGGQLQIGAPGNSTQAVYAIHAGTGNKALAKVEGV